MARFATRPKRGDGRAQKGGTPQRSRSVTFYVFALILVILLPAMAVSLVLLNRTNAAQEDVVQALTNATVQAIGQTIDREIAGMVTTLRVLATSRELEEGDFADLHERGVLALAGSGAYLLALDEEFNIVFNTRLALGTQTGKTSDPITAQAALERNRPTISGVFFGQTAQTNVFTVWLPVASSSEVRLLGLTQNAVDLLPALQSRQLPAGWHAALVDRDSKVVVSTPDAELPIGSLLDLRTDQASSQTWGRNTLDGEKVVTSEWRAGQTGWTVIAWAAASTVEQPLGESILQLAAWGLAIAAAAAFVAVMLARRIEESVRGLQRDARRLGKGELVRARTYPVTEIADISQALSEASEQRIAAERDVRFLMRELAHRSKNQMAVIAAMAKQTARGATDLPTYVAGLERRIMGLARSTDLLLAHGRAGVNLRELIDQQLQPFLPQGEDRVHLSGPSLRINPQGAQILGMALHELATNATRYGAFSDPAGTLSLEWGLNGDKLHMRWRETLSTSLIDSTRSGFGNIVLRTMVGGSLGAEVDRHAHVDGVEWVFRVPLSALDPAFAAARPDEDLRQ
ncbi:MAG: sensor histidine kinase [Phyllobacteriaceae bacterium]|nr:sensor histidine kinase [Phyllobacteriaceae bacterium]